MIDIMQDVDTKTLYQALVQESCDAKTALDALEDGKALEYLQRVTGLPEDRLQRAAEDLHQMYSVAQERVVQGNRYLHTQPYITSTCDDLARLDTLTYTAPGIDEDGEEVMLTWVFDAHDDDGELIPDDEYDWDAVHSVRDALGYGII